MPDAVDALRPVRKLERTGEPITLSGADPRNLVGVIVPGRRVPAICTATVTYVDGLEIDDTDADAEPGELVTA